MRKNLANTQRIRLHDACFNKQYGVLSKIQDIVPKVTDQNPVSLPALLITTINSKNEMSFLVLVFAMSQIAAGLTLPRHPGDYELKQPTIIQSTTIQVDSKIVKEMNSDHPTDFQEVIPPFKAYIKGHKDKGFSDKKITIDRKNPNDPNIGVSTDRKTIEVWAHPK